MEDDFSWVDTNPCQAHPQICISPPSLSCFLARYEDRTCLTNTHIPSFPLPVLPAAAVLSARALQSAPVSSPRNLPFNSAGSSPSRHSFSAKWFPEQRIRRHCDQNEPQLTGSASGERHYLVTGGGITVLHGRSRLAMLASSPSFNLHVPLAALNVDWPRRQSTAFLSHPYTPHY